MGSKVQTTRQSPKTPSIAPDKGSGNTVFHRAAFPDEIGLRVKCLAIAALLIVQLFGGAVYAVDFEAEYAAFASKARACKKFALYEGLPHPRTEASVFASELAKAKSFKQHGHHFYAEALRLSADDASEITDILLSHKMFRRFEEEKLCGGFHPDYMAEWSDEEGHKFSILICLGCHETECYSPNAPIFCDMTDECFASLKKALATKRRSRPNE